VGGWVGGGAGGGGGGEAGPLLIQDMESWTRNGVAGLQVGSSLRSASLGRATRSAQNSRQPSPRPGSPQTTRPLRPTLYPSPTPQSVVLYALPELDGAIDTVPLGGLVGDDIHLVPERVQRMAQRVKRCAGRRGARGARPLGRALPVRAGAPVPPGRQPRDPA
jgi:hypothetical protein